MNKIIGMALINDCVNCFTATLAACTTSITIKAHLEPNTIYTYRICDKFNNRYYHDVTTNADGEFIIFTSDHLNGLFTPYSGSFRIEVLKNNMCDVQALKLCGTEYDCIILDCENGTLENQTIPCCNE